MAKLGVAAGLMMNLESSLQQARRTSLGFKTGKRGDF